MTKAAMSSLPVEVHGKIKINFKIKNVGQECPTHTKRRVPV